MTRLLPPPISALLLQLSESLLQLQGGEGQRDVRGQAGRGLLVRQVLLGAAHADAQVGHTARGRGRVGLAIPLLQGERGGAQRRRRRGRRQRGVRDGLPHGWGGGGGGGLQRAGLPDLDGGGLVRGHLLLQRQDLWGNMGERLTFYHS